MYLCTYVSVQKILKTFIQKFQVLVMVGQRYYQSVPYMVVENSGFIKNQETKGPLSKVPILGAILF